MASKREEDSKGRKREDGRIRKEPWRLQEVEAVASCGLCLFL